MTNLFAICRVSDSLVVKHVKIIQPLQTELENLFLDQRRKFFSNIEAEVDFNGDWKPDPGEVLVLRSNEAANLEQKIAGGVHELDSVTTDSFITDNIRGLFIAYPVEDRTELLVQLFSAQQTLRNKFSLMLSGDSFKKLGDPVFSLADDITAVVSNSSIKFKSFSALKRIFDLSDLYLEATDPQLDEFCSHGCLSVNSSEFKRSADQTTRRLVNAILKGNIMNEATIDDIVNCARSRDLNIPLENGRIVIGDDKKQAKLVLRFLDDGIYRATLSNIVYMTNSKRQLG